MRSWKKVHLHGAPGNAERLARTQTSSIMTLREPSEARLSQYPTGDLAN